MKLRLAAALVSAAVLALTGREARADGTVWAAPTAFVSVSLGDRPVVGLGIDVRMTVLAQGTTDSCNFRQRWGAGPFLQATWLIPNGGRFAFGAHLGADVAESAYSAEGELGWTYRTSLDERPGGHGVHLGVTNIIFPAQTIALRTTFSSFGGAFVPEGTVALGGGFPQAFGLPGTCIID